MKLMKYICVLIMSLAFVLWVIFTQNTLDKVNLLPGQINGLKQKIEAIETISAQSGHLKDIIDGAARITEAYEALSEENARLQAENASLRDYIDGFWEFMEGEYDFEGHQERYMERIGNE